MSAAERTPAGSPEQRRRLPHWLGTALQVLVSVALLAGLFLFADTSALRAAAHSLSAGTILLVVVIGFGSQAMFVIRWRALLASLDLREAWSRSWHTVFAGLFLTNFLPGTLGSDGLRAFLLIKAHGDAPRAIGAVLYDRATQFALYVALVALAALAPVPGFALWFRALVVVCGVAGLVVLWLILKWLSRRPRDDGGEGGLSLGIWRFSNAVLRETGAMQARMRANPGVALGFWGAGLANAVLVFAVWWIGLRGIGEGVQPALIVLAAGGAVLATVLPVSVGGVGLYEAVGVALFGLAGVTVEHALLAALIVRAIVMLSSLVGLPSVILLWRSRQR